MEHPAPASAARYRQIVETLARHGFGHLVAQLGFRRLLPPWGGGGPSEGGGAPRTRGERLRLVFEDLGPTFIKLGQILSCRADLLPDDVAAELTGLQDAVPPEPFAAVEATIARELGQRPAAVFAQIDREPLGSASIGQVHAARLFTGERVVVKVQRSGVEQRVEEDLAILVRMANLAQARTPWGRVHNLPAIAEEFAETLREELDYLREGRNAERIRHNFRREPAVHAPAVYWPYTTRRVLTMEYIPGIKISDIPALRAAGVDLPALAVALLRMSIKMMLEDGFFHADPHPGNFVVEAGGVIGLLDHGMVGALDDQAREDVLYLLLAIVEQDIDRVVDQLLALGIIGTTYQIEQMKRDVGHLITRGLSVTSRGTDIRHFLDGILIMAYRRQLQIPASLVLMSKTIMMHEALARACDPQVNAAEILGEYAQGVAIRANLPWRVAARALPTLFDMSRLALVLPRRVNRLLLQAEQGHMSVNIRLQEVEHVLEALNRMVNRLALAIVAAGLIVGIALLLQAAGPAGLQALARWFLLAAFAGAVALAVWVIVSIFRRRHH